MVINMKSDCDTEIPLENFFTGKWHIDDNCLIPAPDLHNPSFRKSIKNKTVENSSNIIKAFVLHNERIVTGSKTLINSSECNDNLKTESEKRRRIEQENICPEIKSNSLELPLKRRGRPQKIRNKKIRTSSSSMQSDDDDDDDDSNKVSEIPTQKRGRPRKDDNIKPIIQSSNSCSSCEDEDTTKNKANNEKKISSDSTFNLEENSESSSVRKDGKPDMKEIAKNSGHSNPKKGTEFVSQNVKKRGRPRKDSVEKICILSGSSSSSENIRENSGDTPESQALLVRKIGRPKKIERANNSENFNPNKRSHSPFSSSQNVQKRGRPGKDGFEKDCMPSCSSISSENIRKNSGDLRDSSAPVLKKVGRPKKSERAYNSEHINPIKGSQSLSVKVQKRGRPRKDASERAHIQPCSSSSEREQGTISPFGLAALPVQRRGRPKKIASKRIENEFHGISSQVESDGITGNKAETTKRNNSESSRSSRKSSSVSPVKIGGSTKKGRENNPQAVHHKGNLKGTFSRAGRPLSVTKYTSDETDVFESDDEWMEPYVKHMNARQFKNYSKNKAEEEIKKRGKKIKGYMDAKAQSKVVVRVNSDTTVNQNIEQEPLKPEECHVTAKRGTLKYLQQREKFVDAVMKEAQVDDDFLSTMIPDKMPGKKNVLSNLLASSSPDDSLTIKTPQGKGKLINSNIITPRTMKLGEWANGSPWCDTVTPSTTSSAPESEKKEALEVIYHYMKGRKRRTQPIRKVLSDRSNSSDEMPTQTQLIQLPALPEIPEDRCSDSSEDDYFNSSNAP